MTTEQIITRLANRTGRYLRLRDLSAPQILLDRETDLIRETIGWAGQDSNLRPPS